MKNFIPDTQKQIIIFDRLELYRDFVINLTHYITHYYIDDGSFDKEDVEKFFDWCYKRVCDEFHEEDINFYGNEKLKNYLKKYFYKTYFFGEVKQKDDDYFSFWNGLFIPSAIKENNKINLLIEIYSLFDETINSRKKENLFIEN